MPNLRATERHFAFLASCVTGYDVTVKITEDGSYVGYTSMPSGKKAEIVLSHASELYKGMTEPVKLMNMLGVLAHECMHLCFTNFDAINLKSIVLSRKTDKDAFFELSNVVEDPAIEYFAPSKIGGKMLKALASIIKHTWMTAPDIEHDIPKGKEDAFAYTQVVRAMIQVGDRGILKGRFVSKLAEDAFRKVLPLMNAAIVEPDSAKRVDYYVAIYRILEPLNRKEAQENQQMSKGMPMKMPQGLGEGEPSNQPDDGEGDGNGSGTSKSEEAKQNLRKKLETKLSDEESKDKASGQKGEESNDGKQSKEVNESAASESKDGEEKGSAAAGKEDGDGEESGNAQQESTDGEAERQSSRDDNAEKKSSQSSDFKQGEEPSKAPEERPYEASDRDVDALEDADKEMEFDESDLESLQNDIKSVETQIEVSERAERELAAKSNAELPLDSEDVINVTAQNPDEERYNKIVNAYGQKIATLTNEMRKIFANDISRTKISNHGVRVCTKRLVDGKLHSDIMLSRKQPKDLDNMAVYILMDKSGSMSHANKSGKSNAQCASETAICIYEALRALRVPVYITGFTTRGSKALHVHYVTWNSPMTHRYRLANFSADDCNYDYYSIADATRILKKHPAKHKLLIVLSDGAPCNPSHGMHNLTGVEATAAAVEFARKTADVLGVAMNCYDEKLYAEMYGKDYITVSTANDMFVPIAETLQKIVKNW